MFIPFLFPLSISPFSCKALDGIFVGWKIHGIWPPLALQVDGIVLDSLCNGAVVVTTDSNAKFHSSFYTCPPPCLAGHLLDHTMLEKVSVIVDTTKLSPQ
jgi:hypothetical protein